MKPKPLLLASAASLAFIGALLVPGQSSAQSDAETTALNALLTEITAQQTVIAENHVKIDDKLAAVGEEIRLARIYAGRGGGAGKAK
jgi:hypothetical protein